MAYAQYELVWGKPNGGIYRVVVELKEWDMYVPLILTFVGHDRQHLGHGVVDSFCILFCHGMTGTGKIPVYIYNRKTQTATEKP